MSSIDSFGQLYEKCYYINGIFDDYREHEEYDRDGQKIE
jgi:hypothetical protein